jgi:hypothetical protein
MGGLMKVLKVLFLFTLILFPVLVFGQDVVNETTLSDLLTQISTIFNSWAAWSVTAKISGILFLAVGSIKNSIISKYTWDKLGKFKFIVAPAFSLIAHLIIVSPFTWNTVWLALTTGICSGFLADLLDAIKVIPGIGTTWVKIVTWIGSLLGKSAGKSADKSADK